jgi:methionyl-tRNA synthetase
MTCSHCSAVEQRGRYCVGCGKLMPPSSTPPRRIRVAPRPAMDDDTQPVLRFRANGRPLVHAVRRETASAS